MQVSRTRGLMLAALLTCASLWWSAGLASAAALSTIDGGNLTKNVTESVEINSLAREVPQPAARQSRVVAATACASVTTATATASGDDGNVPANVLDGDLSTRWSHLGIGSWIQLDLGSTRSVCDVEIAWYQGDTRVNHFVIQTSTDGRSFTDALSTDSSGMTREIKAYAIGPALARYVRVTVNGNTKNDWASITELGVNRANGTPPPPTPEPRPRGPAIWMSKAELAALPTSGAAWDRLKATADGDLGVADIADQNSEHDTNTLAVALVYARTGDNTYRAKAANAIIDAIGTEAGGRTLALGRNLVSYVIAADLIDLRSYDSAKDQRFRAWLSAVRNETLDGQTLIVTHENRPNNWGTHAGASRVAADLYLGDTADLARAAKVFKGWLGDRASYAGFAYGDLSWQADPNNPVGINPKGATKSGYNVDGVLPDDQRRAGGFTWPAPNENYVWEALQGATVEAELLSRAGYDAWNWSDRALLRAVTWEYNVNGFAPGGDDTWQPWLINHVYGTNFATNPAQTGKNMGFTDWMYG